MTNRREKAPMCVVTKTKGGLSPMSQYDAELYSSFLSGAEFDLVPRTKRSNKQLRLYWAMLGRVVKATGKWPDAEHLHSDLKIVLGYYVLTVNVLTGEERIEPDSAALDKMDADQFRAFFDGAVEVLAERLGFDPLAFTEGGRAAA